MFPCFLHILFISWNSFKQFDGIAYFLQKLLSLFELDSLYLGEAWKTFPLFISNLDILNLMQCNADKTACIYIAWKNERERDCRVRAFICQHSGILNLKTIVFKLKVKYWIMYIGCFSLRIGVILGGYKRSIKSSLVVHVFRIQIHHTPQFHPVICPA